MEIWVYNQYTDQREVVKVGDETVTIGRDEANDVTLRSPFASRRHARIVREGGTYFVESLGLNETVVANKVVAHKHKQKIGYGDEIRIGEFSLYMMEPTALRLGAAERGVSPRKKVIELEQKMHAELLERLNLRVTGTIGSVDEQHVALIKRHLADIIEAQMKEVADEMAAYLVQQFLWRCVVTEAARRATGKLMYSYGFEGSDLVVQKHEEAIARMVGDVLGSLPLRLRPHTLKEDIAAVEADWPGQMKTLSARITPDLRDYIVRRMLSREIEDVVLGYGPLQDLLEMPNINEIMVIGKDHIYIEKDGAVQNTGRSFFSEEIVQSIIERIITPVGRRIDRSTPLVDARLADGSRVNAIINPLSLSGPVLTIRKFARIPFTIDDLIERDTLTEETASFLRSCVLGRTAAGAPRAPGNASGQCRRPGRLHHPRPGPQRLANEAGPPDRRRVPRARSAGHASGDEYRPRRLVDHHLREQSGRHADAPGDDGPDGGRDACPRHPRADDRRARSDRADCPPRRRPTQNHPYLRDRRHRP